MMFPPDGLLFLRILVAAGAVYFGVRFLALGALAIMEAVNTIP